jgi:EmrB/QacA subfamily drug resistance transporter
VPVIRGTDIVPPIAIDADRTRPDHLRPEARPDTTVTPDAQEFRMPVESSTAASPSPPPPTFSHRQIVVIISALMSGMFLASLDQTIVSTSIRVISDDLHGLSLQAWATTAYLITSTITTPLYGKLSDIHGRRPFLLFAISVFVIGSVLSGLSQSMYQLAVFRGIQGIGAGGLMSLALAIIGDIIPPRERARYQGYFLAVFGVSSVLGPVAGGLLADQSQILGVSGWRWVFLINVPIGLFSLLLVARVLHLPHVRRDHRIDYMGAATLTGALIPLLIVAEQGQSWGWTSPRAVLSIAIGVVGAVAFILTERRMGPQALLPLRLFSGRTFFISTVLNFIIGMGMFGALVSLPLYLQIVKGKSPTVAGLLLIPLVLGLMVGSVVSGQVTARTGRYRIFPIVGLALLLTGTLLLSRMTVDSSLVVVDLYAAIFGLGLGFNMQTLVLAMQNAVPPQDMGVATSSATFFRQMGGTLGVAVFLSVLFSTVTDRITSAFRAAGPTAEFRSALEDPRVLADPTNREVIRSLAGARSGGAPDSMATGVLDDSSFLNQVDPRLARPFLIGFADSISLVFLLGAVVFALAFVVVWFLPEEKLSHQSGIQARHSQEPVAGEGPGDTSVAPQEIREPATGAGHRAPDGPPSVPDGS